MQTVTILGINGRVGQAIAGAFVDANWRVIGMGRSNRAQLAGVEFFEGDVDFPDQTRRAVAEADVVVNAINLPYDKWGKGRAEKNLANVLEALRGSAKTLMFPGNMYNWSARQHVIRPDTPQHPEKEKGRIRKRMEEQLREASERGDVRVIILRMADFFGPHAVQSNFDLMLMARIKSNILQYNGDLSNRHSWAYLPDVGRAFVRLAEKRSDFGSFENFHFAGYFVTGHEMIGAIQKVLPKRARVKQIPLNLMRFIGIFVPILRAVMEMNYLWEEPHRLEDPRLEAILGEGFATPFEEAVARTATSYLGK